MNSFRNSGSYIQLTTFSVGTSPEDLSTAEYRFLSCEGLVPRLIFVLLGALHDAEISIECHPRTET